MHRHLDRGAAEIRAWLTWCEPPGVSRLGMRRRRAVSRAKWPQQLATSDFIPTRRVRTTRAQRAFDNWSRPGERAVLLPSATRQLARALCIPTDSLRAKPERRPVQTSVAGHTHPSPFPDQCIRLPRSVPGNESNCLLTPRPLPYWTCISSQRQQSAVLYGLKM